MTRINEDLKHRQYSINLNKVERSIKEAFELSSRALATNHEFGQHRRRTLLLLHQTLTSVLLDFLPPEFNGSDHL